MAKQKRMTNADVERFTCGVYASGKKAGQRRDQDVLWDGGENCCKGLGLRLSAATGTRTFIFLYRVQGKEILQTIGRYGDGWRLGHHDPAWDPREAARDLKRKMKQGINPVEEKAQALATESAAKVKTAALATTLRQVVALYMERRVLAPSTIRDMKGHSRRNFAGWLDLPVAGITKGMCLEKFLNISKRAPQQANSAMVYLSCWLNFARDDHALADGTYPVLPVNPVTAMFKTQDKNPERPRTRHIPLERVGHVWNFLRESTSGLHADFASTLMLTGMRWRECASLRWTDVDLEKRTITLRKEVTKNHHELVLPMSDLLHGVVSARKPNDAQPSDFVFPSQKLKSGGCRTKSGHVGNPRGMMDRVAVVAGCVVTDEKGKKQSELSVHDFRRGLDAIAQACRIDGDTRRLLLNHKSGDVHYQHYASRQGLTGAVGEIANYIENAALVAKSPKVVQFSGRVAS
jgi:integrase